MNCQILGCDQPGVQVVDGFTYCQRHLDAVLQSSAQIAYDEQAGGPFIVSEGRRYKATLRQMVKQYDDSLTDQVNLPTDEYQVFLHTLIRELRREVERTGLIAAIHGL